MGHRLALTNAFAVIVLVGFAHNARAQLAGYWDASEGAMQLAIVGNKVTGSYSQDNGRIGGWLTNRTVEGFWIEDGSNERCATARDGSHHWGRIKWTFDQKLKTFKGEWGYCIKVPTRSCTGTRVCGEGKLSVSWPRQITREGPCFSYHVAHRGLELYGEFLAHDDSITYSVKTDCPELTVVGHVKGQIETVEKKALTSSKNLKNGKEGSAF